MAMDKITKLGFYLLFIMSIVTIILIQNSDNLNQNNYISEINNNSENKVQTTKTIEILSESKKKENRELISTKNVGKINTEKVVVKDSNGDLYILNDGRVIAGNLLLIKNDKEIFIQRLNDKEKIIYN